MIKRSVVLVFLLVFMVSVFAGCGGKFTRDAYRTLAVTAQSYQVAKATAQELYDQGQLTEDQKDKLNSKARVFRVAYHAAVDALEMYEKGFQTAEDVSGSLTRLSELLFDIENLIEKGDL